MPKPQQSALISLGALSQFQVTILPLARATSQLTREDIRFALAPKAPAIEQAMLMPC